MSECSYCSNPVKARMEDNTILECSFCGKISLVEEERQITRLKRKQRSLRNIGNRRGRRRQEAECEHSCVTTADESYLSDSGSSASSSKVNDSVNSSERFNPTADVTVSTKSSKRK